MSKSKQGFKDPKAYFVTAIGTDLGKTFLVENLCRNLTNVAAIKPIASGFCDDDLNSDSAKILRALSLTHSIENLNSITPWRFKEAVSPHFAAAKHGTKINFSAVREFCQNEIILAKEEKKNLFIEGAGGVMTPINDEKTFLDLMSELEIPVILVSANYLGAISHTLCAVEALKARGVVIDQIIVNEDLPTFVKSADSVIETLQRFAAVDVISISNFFKKLS